MEATDEATPIPADLDFSDSIGMSQIGIEFRIYELDEVGEDGNALMMRSSARSAAPHLDLIAKLESKSRKYGISLGNPFIIALWPLPMMVDDFFIELALVDKEQGFFWLRKEGRLLNQHVSAVAICQCHLSEDGAKHLLTLYLNPNAQHPLADGLFGETPDNIEVRVVN